MIILILKFYLYTIKDYILYLNQTSGVIIKMTELNIFSLLWDILNGVSDYYDQFAMIYVQFIDPTFNEEVGMLDLGWTPPAK